MTKRRNFMTRERIVEEIIKIYDPPKSAIVPMVFELTAFSKGSLQSKLEALRDGSDKNRPQNVSEIK